MFALLEAIPEIVWWGIGVAGIGAGVKSAAQGTSTASDSLTRLVLVGTAAYFIVKGK